MELSRISFQPQELFDPKSIKLLDALKKLEAKLSLYKDDIFSQNLADYLFVPIASLLKQKSLGDSQTELLLLIISHLLRLCWRETGSLPKELSKQLLPLINFLISQDTKNVDLKKRSIGYRTSSSCVLSEYFKSLWKQPYATEFFSSPNSVNLPSLGHSITILLDILENTSQDMQIQIQVLETLLLLYQDILCDGELLSFVLPGNVSSFCKILTKPGITVNYKVATKTLHAFSVLLTLVYDDFSLNVQVKRTVDLRTISPAETNSQDLRMNRAIIIGERNSGNKRLHRDTSWLQATSAQIKIALNSFIPKIQKRNNPHISNALADFASEILIRCSKSLSNCRESLVAALVMLRKDPKNQLPSHFECLIDVIKSYTSKLDHMIQFDNSEGFKSLIFALNVLASTDFRYEDLMIYGISNTAAEVILSIAEQYKVKNGVAKIIEQSENVFITDSFEKNLVERDREHTDILPNISSEIETSLASLFKILGSMSNNQNRLTELVGIFLSDNTTESVSRKSISLWISSWLLLGIQNPDNPIEEDFLNIWETKQSDITACYRVLEYSEGLAQEIAFSSEGAALGREGEFSLCTVLFAIESACTVLKEDFKFELIDHIYTVVENLASSSPVVRQYAQSCAIFIAERFYQASLKDMIVDNMDYLVESISARLNSGMIQRVSAVLMVFCKLAGYEVFNNFKDIFETIFKLLDYYHGYDDMCVQFFDLFSVIISEMKKSYFLSNDMRLESDPDLANRTSYAPWGMTNIQQLFCLLDEEKDSEGEDIIDGNLGDAKSFQEYFDSKVRDVDSDDEDGPGNEYQNESQQSVKESADHKNEVKWLSPIPVASYRIILQIFNYGDRLLTHKSRTLRIKILILMKLMVPMLASQYDSLLPQIALSWDTVVDGSIDSDLSIVKCACDCLQEMVCCSQDFIIKRFLDLWATWKKKSLLLRHLHCEVWSSFERSDYRTLLSRKQIFPPVTSKALVSMCEVLLQGISVTGLMLSDATLKEMIYCCLQIIPARKISEQSIVAADVVYAITHEIG